MKRTNYYNNYKDSITILTQYNYDPQGRKTSTALTINKSTPIIIDSLQYNELGQLKTKKLHVNNNVALESIEYKYNPRNWLTEAIGINFKQKLFYEKAVNGSTPLYNGTISAQQFGVNAEKEEKYYYDKLNRITNYTNTNNNTETIEYADKLGNIKKITRTGESTATIAFAYNGNRISQANNKNYLYNVNGSVLNNGEINISNYNELNLPNRISKANTTMYFTYTADGKKIFKNIDNKEVRFYDDGIEFIKARLDSPNVKLEIINTDNGKIQVKGTKYYYQYFLKDHLGNVRAIVSDSNRAVIQRADYYAFGKVRLQGDTAIKYLYNGNEYQAGLDVYDFNARTYDPVTGRFLQVDPNVEDGEQQGFNPYHFSFDNPIRYNDPDGRCPTCLAAIIGAVAGSLIGGGIEVASQLYNNGSVNNWRAVGGSTLQGALTGAVTGLTGGGSLLTTATVSGITNAIGGTVNRKIQGQGTTLTDFSVDAGIGAVLGAGTKIVSSIFGGALNKVSNNVPDKLARVVPNEKNYNYTMLGNPNDKDVFVTATKDIKGLNAKQISNKLTIPQSNNGYKIFEFNTPTGIASPINRNNLGFIGKGRTAGGAREFVIPNQTIPKNATIKIIQ